MNEILLEKSRKLKIFEGRKIFRQESIGIENRLKESVKESESRIDWEVRNRNRKESEKVESGVH